MKKYQTYVLLALEHGRHYHEVYKGENMFKLFLAYAIESELFRKMLKDVVEISENLTPDEVDKLKVTVN